MAEPRAVTIPGSPAGHNCLLSVRSYGSRVVRVERLSYGFDMVYTEEQGADGRVMYPLSRDTPGFTLDLVFLTRGERDDFNTWLSGYMRRVATNQRIGGYVYVTVPARRFARNGVPVGPLAYGDSVGTVAYRTSLEFVGVVDPVASVAGTKYGAASFYKAATRDTTDAPHFYPSGSQRAGAESLEGTLYDPRPPGSGEVGEPAAVRGAVPAF